MPKLNKETSELRGRHLAKTLLDNGLNQAAVARKLGVTKQAINQRIQHTPVNDALQEYFKSDKLRARLIKVAEEGLLAKSKGRKDYTSRHKFWHDLVFGTGALKSAEVSVGVQVYCGSEVISAIKQVESSRTKSQIKND